MRRLRSSFAIIVVATAAFWAAPLPAQDVPPIAAASDLQFALGEIATAFEAGTGSRLRLSFGSSGNFTSQLLYGAPFEMFLSADEGFVFRLADAGRTLDRGMLYAVGRLALFAPHGAPLTVDTAFNGLRMALAEGRIRRFAIANPTHAPYGRAAEQALASQGLWEAIRPKLVLGENVSQAAQFAISGSSDGAMFALSLALAPAVGSRGSHVLVPDTWHAALYQRMVLMKNAGNTARAFFAYMQSPPARAILRKHGFALPDGSS